MVRVRPKILATRSTAAPAARSLMLIIKTGGNDSNAILKARKLPPVAIPFGE